jgi:hypothetical protein
MTPRELAGWVPAERHEHFDADDNLTGYTIVIRESRIDDADRAALLGLAQFEAELSPCGFHPSVASDPDNAWAFEVDECLVCAALAQGDRDLQDKDRKWSEANPNAAPRAKRPSDGQHGYMRFLSPHEAAVMREERSTPRAERS